MTKWRDYTRWIREDNKDEEMLPNLTQQVKHWLHYLVLKATLLNSNIKEWNLIERRNKKLPWAEFNNQWDLILKLHAGSMKIDSNREKALRNHTTQMTTDRGTKSQGQEEWRKETEKNRTRA